MPERRDAADGVSRCRSHEIRLGAPAVGSSRFRRQPSFVELVGAAHERDDGLAVDREHERLHDLADLDADRRRRVGRGLGSLWERPDRNRKPEVLRQPRSHARCSGASAHHGRCQTGPVRDWLVGGALIESPDGLLLVQNRRRDGSHDWSTPGGVIEEGEELLAGLAREVEEETGLVVTEWAGPVYEVLIVAPEMGWRLRVEAHLAVAFEGELTVADPDGIVVDARFVAATSTKRICRPVRRGFVSRCSSGSRSAGRSNAASSTTSSDRTARR